MGIGKGSNTSTTTTSANPVAMDVYKQILAQAQNVAATPYQPYGGELVAPVNAQQNMGIANINQNAGYAAPAVGLALNYANQAAQPITPQQIQQYMSPYTQNVVNATQAQFNNQNARQQQQVLGNAISQGALGGNRVGIAQAELANQQNLAQAPVIANLMNQGYQTGLNTALSQQQAMASGAQNLGSLGIAGQNAALSGANAQVGAGTLQQQTQQAQDTAQYQQYLNALGYPFQTTGWLANIASGVGSQMGGTSVTQGPTPNGFSQLLGGLTSGVGMLGATGAFGSTGWLAAAGLATGGAAEGDDEDTGVANQEMTVPETMDTLQEQQRQLLSGQRRAQMFPHGTDELPLPLGMERSVTANGIFHYNPAYLDMNTIHSLSGEGRENELLDLGPISKREVLERVARGEQPVAIVERTPSGIEVRAAAGTNVTAPIQIAAMEKTKSPGNIIKVEHPDQTIQRRLSGAVDRASGGVVGYADGGMPMGVMPYSGGMGYVPTIQMMARGNTMPRSGGQTQSQQQQTPDWEKFSKAMTPALQDLGNYLKLGDDGLGHWNDPNWDGGTPLEGSDPFGYGSNTMGPRKRGGPVGVANFADGGAPTYVREGHRILNDRTVPGYADGGMPTFDDRFNGADDFNSRFTGDGSTVQPNTLGEVAKPESGLYNRLSENVPEATVGEPLVRPSQGFPDQGVAPPAAPTEAAPPAPPAPSPTLVGPEGGVVLASNSPGTPAGGAGYDGVAPRGIRNNNPGNIEDGPFARSQPGYVGSDGRFARFETPQAGMQAASNLLAGYGAKGFNTVSSIINRWAPAADNNDTAAYIRAVSAKLGVDPNQPLNMSDPQVRAALSEAIAAHENGIPNIQNTLTARSYNRGVIPERTGGTGMDLSAASRSPQGVANSNNGVDWSEKGKLWPSLISAGFAMMASRSPFFGTAVGEGGLAGQGTYENLRQQEAQRSMQQQRIDMQARQLAQQAEIAARPYNEMTMAQRRDAEFKRIQLQQAAERNALALKSPVDTGRTDANYNPIKALPRMNKDTGELEFWPIITGPDGQPTLANSPLGGSMAEAAGRAFQQQNPGAMPPTQQPGPARLQTAAFNPDRDGVMRVNEELVKQGNFDYGKNAPYIEKGMDVPEPQGKAGKSPQALKTDAEYYLQTGKLPQISRGNSPVARAQQEYQDAVKNYAGALAQSRGFTPQEIAEAWRSAPGMLRFILGADGRATVSLGTAVRHLDTLAEYAQAWKAGNVQLMNRLAASIGRQFGSVDATNLESVAHILGPEIVKAIGVAGAGTEKDREGMAAQFSTARSYDQVMGAIAATQKLMAGQLTGKRQQAALAGVDESRFKKLIGDRPYELLSKLEAGSDGKHGGGDKPALPPGVPEGSLYSQSRQQYKAPDGTIYDKNGKKVQ